MSTAVVDLADVYKAITKSHSKNGTLQNSTFPTLSQAIHQYTCLDSMTVCVHVHPQLNEMMSKQVNRLNEQKSVHDIVSLGSPLSHPLEAALPAASSEVVVKQILVSALELEQAMVSILNIELNDSPHARFVPASLATWHGVQMAQSSLPKVPEFDFSEKSLFPATFQQYFHAVLSKDNIPNGVDTRHAPLLCVYVMPVGASMHQSSCISCSASALTVIPNLNIYVATNETGQGYVRAHGQGLIIQFPPFERQNNQNSQNNYQNLDQNPFISNSPIPWRRALFQAVNEFLLQQMQQRIQQWTEQVAQPRRGLTGRFFSASKRYFSEKDAVSNSTELFQLFSLASHLMALQQYKLALEMWTFLRKEVKEAMLGVVMERQLLCVWLLQDQVGVMRYFDEILKTPMNVTSLSLVYKIRALIWWLWMGQTIRDTNTNSHSVFSLNLLIPPIFMNAALPLKSTISPLFLYYCAAHSFIALKQQRRALLALFMAENLNENVDENEISISHSLLQSMPKELQVSWFHLLLKKWIANNFSLSSNLFYFLIYCLHLFANGNADSLLVQNLIQRIREFDLFSCQIFSCFPLFCHWQGLKNGGHVEIELKNPFPVLITLNQLKLVATKEIRAEVDLKRANHLNSSLALDIALKPKEHLTVSFPLTGWESGTWRCVALQWHWNDKVTSLERIESKQALVHLTTDSLSLPVLHGWEEMPNEMKMNEMRIIPVQFTFPEPSSSMISLSSDCEFVLVVADKDKVFTSNSLHEWKHSPTLIACQNTMIYIALYFKKLGHFNFNLLLNKHPGKAKVTSFSHSISITPPLMKINSFSLLNQSLLAVEFESLLNVEWIVKSPIYGLSRVIGLHQNTNQNTTNQIVLFALKELKLDEESNLLFEAMQMKMKMQLQQHGKLEKKNFPKILVHSSNSNSDRNNTVSGNVDYSNLIHHLLELERTKFRIESLLKRYPFMSRDQVEYLFPCWESHDFSLILVQNVSANNNAIIQHLEQIHSFSFDWHSQLLHFSDQRNKKVLFAETLRLEQVWLKAFSKVNVNLENSKAFQMVVKLIQFQETDTFSYSLLLSIQNTQMTTISWSLTLKSHTDWQWQGLLTRNESLNPLSECELKLKVKVRYSSVYHLHDFWEWKLNENSNKNIEFVSPFYVTL